MLLFTVQALGEMAVIYPVNGSFYSFFVRFIDPAWGFAVGWDYALGWLTVLPFGRYSKLPELEACVSLQKAELTAAGITLAFWRPDLNVGIWIAVFFVALCIIQVFGVRGYGEGMI